MDSEIRNPDAVRRPWPPRRIDTNPLTRRPPTCVLLTCFVMRLPDPWCPDLTMSMLGCFSISSYLLRSSTCFFFPFGALASRKWRQVLLQYVSSAHGFRIGMLTGLISFRSAPRFTNNKEFCSMNPNKELWGRWPILEQTAKYFVPKYVSNTALLSILFQPSSPGQQ